MFYIVILMLVFRLGAKWGRKGSNWKVMCLRVKPARGQLCWLVLRVTQLGWFDSLFKGLLRSIMMREVWIWGQEHEAAAMRRQRNECWVLPSYFLLSLGLQPMACSYLNSWWVFLPRLSFSGSTLLDMPRGTPLMWLQTHPEGPEDTLNSSHKWWCLLALHI